MLFATYGDPRFIEYLKFENFEHEVKSPLELTNEEDYIMFAELKDWQYQDVLQHVPQKVIDDIKNRCAILLYYIPDPDINIENTVEFHGFICEKYDIDFFSFRILSTNFLINRVEPFLYFCDAEFEYRIEFSNDDDKIQTFERDRLISIVDPLNNEYGTLIKSLIWQQGLLPQAYFEHQKIPEGKEIFSWKNRFRNVEGVVYPYSVHLPINQVDEDMLRKSLFHIVVQDWYDKDIQHINIDTFEAIDNNCLFMLLGSPGVYEILHSLGYMSFSRYIQDDYDEELSNEIRLHGFFTEMYKALHESPEYHQNILKDTKPIRDSNRGLLNKNKIDRIQQLLEEL